MMGRASNWCRTSAWTTASVPQGRSAATRLAIASVSVWSQVRSPSTLLAAQAPSPRAGHRQGSPSPCVAVKQGSCPKDPLRCLSPIQHLCHQDSDCRGSSRCCLGACGRDCRNPVKGMVPVHLGQVLSLSEPQLMISFQLNTLNRIPSQQPGPPCSQNWGSG